MYDEMTNSDFICLLYEKAHPANNPSAEHALILDEAARRIQKLEYRVIELKMEYRVIELERENEE